MAEPAAGATAPTVARWSAPGMQARLRTWIVDTLAAAGLPTPVRVDLRHERLWSAIFRITTSSGPLWCKVNVPGLAQEAAVLGVLSRCPPLRVPRLIGVEEHAGWFICEDAGIALQDVLAADLDLRHWEAAIAQYGQLQRDTEGRVDELIAAGALDARASVLSGRLHAFLHEEIELLSGPGGLNPAEFRALQELLPTFNTWCCELDDTPVPATVQHDDLTDDNIFVRGPDHVFLDWADASVAHPFASLIYPERHVARTFGVDVESAQIRRLRDAYLEPWTDLMARNELHDARRIAVCVAAVGRAVAWRRALAGQSRSALEPYFASAEARWLRTLLGREADNT